jgi:hypothetical protein
MTTGRRGDLAGKGQAGDKDASLYLSTCIDVRDIPNEQEGHVLSRNYVIALVSKSLEVRAKTYQSL